jgi:hypothetical protein
MWPVEGAALGVQARFNQPERGAGSVTLERVYVTWRDRFGEGIDPATAWAGREAGGAVPDATGAAPRLWDSARRLLLQADSALRAGDVERFGRLYAELHRLFGLERAQLAPAGPRP